PGARGPLLVCPGLRELADDPCELGEAVLGAFEEVARRGEEALGTPGAVEHGALGEPVQTERPVYPVECDLDARLARRLRAVVPGELAVADVVAVAVTEVDPVPIGTSHGAAAAAAGVRLLEDDDPLAVAGEDRARDQPGERRADDHDVGLCLAGTHGRGDARTAPGGCQRSTVDSLRDPQ